MDEPRRISRAAGDDAFRGTRFRRDVRKLLWTARHDPITLALELVRSRWGPNFGVQIGAHVDGIVQPVSFDPREISSYVLYTHLGTQARPFDESLLNFEREIRAEERGPAIARELRMRALPLLERLATLDGVRAFAADEPADSGFGQRLRWLLGVGPRPEWMQWDPPA